MSKKNSKSGKLTSIKGGKGFGESGGGTDGREPNGNTLESVTTTETPTKVIDFGTVRAQRNLDNRRNFERFFLQHMIHVYCEVGGAQPLMPVEAVEVSESGCSFRLSIEKSKTLPRDTKGEIIPLHVRFYFSRDSYLRVGLFVINSNRDIADGGGAVRLGCKVDEAFASTEAYREMVRFMEQLSKHALRDAKQVSSY